MSDYKPNNCYEFSCGTNQKISDLKTPCIQVNHTSNTIIANRCDSSKELSCTYFTSYEMPESSWSDTYCVNISTPKPDCTTQGEIETGQQCCASINCLSRICIDGYCKGKSSGSDCTTSPECSVNLYCKDSLCTATKALDEKCESDEECDSGLGCNLGACTQIFGLDSGSEAQDKKFCLSNFMLDGKCDKLTVKIRDEDGVLYPPYMCSQGDICDLYTYNGSHYRDYKCLCAGYNNLPEGFCGYELVNAGDAMSNVFYELRYSSSRCSGNNSHTDDPVVLLKCNSISKEQFLLYWNIHNQLYYYNIYVTGALDSCADTYNLWDYTYSFNDYYNFSVLPKLYLACIFFTSF